jgi:uncharacterized phage protein (TIGR02218 family)
MKEVTQAYTDKEESNERKPVELYHIWRDGGENWYYTDGDVAVDFGGNTYEVATLSRGSVRYNSKLEAQTLKISASYLEAATVTFISINPVEILWVSVMKLHRDQVPLEASNVFVGQIKTVLFKGKLATADCVGFEHFLKKPIPVWRYQLNCNHRVFDDKCALTKSSYKTTTAITLDSTGLVLTSSAFGAQADGFFIGGEVTFGDESRTITAHVGNNVTLMYKFLLLASTDTVDAYPGCDGRAETCRDKYSNINNFLGFPFIPSENPALRVSW